MDALATTSTIAPQVLAQRALESNKAHQYALTTYAERLAAELRDVDKLLNAVNIDEGEDEPESDIQVPGAVKATAPFTITDLLKPDSPFYEEASRRSRYISYTNSHPMKAKELEALAEAVRSENQRLQAYESQRSQGSGAIPVQIDIDNNTDGLDWTVIAEKVTSASNVKRTADECRIKWLGERHPRLNHGEWTALELEQLQDFVSQKMSWVEIAKKLGTNRTPIDCMRRGLPRPRHAWTSTSDEKLINAVKRYGVDNWNLVARYVSEDATAAQCQGRYSRTLDPEVKRGSWSKEEDERLGLAVAAYGNLWSEIAASIPGRTNDQCRERWSDQNSASAPKSSWTEEEDKILLDGVNTLGNQWKIISAKVGNGRTGVHCRLRYDKLQKLQASTSMVAGPSNPHSATDSPATKELGTDTVIERPKPKRRSQKATVKLGKEDAEDIMTSTDVKKSRPKPRPVRKSKGKEPGPTADVNTMASTNNTETTEDVIGVDTLVMEDSTSRLPEEGKKRGPGAMESGTDVARKKKKTARDKDATKSDLAEDTADEPVVRKRGRRPKPSIKIPISTTVAPDAAEQPPTANIIVKASNTRPMPKKRIKKVEAPTAEPTSVSSGARGRDTAHAHTPRRSARFTAKHTGTLSEVAHKAAVDVQGLDEEGLELSSPLTSLDDES